MSETTTSHIDQVRQLMLDQLKALRAAPAGPELYDELKRSRGVSELSQTIINSAKVEVEYLAVIHGDGEVPFLAAPDDCQPKLPPVEKRTDPLLSGPAPGHPWRSSVHRLKG